MGIRLRRFSRNRLVKAAAFTLTVILLSGLMMQMHYLSNSELRMESLFVSQYSRSEKFKYGELSNAMYNVTVNLMEYGNEVVHNPEYLYYISDGKNSYKNAEIEDITQHKQVLYIFKDGQWANPYNYHMQEDYTLYLSFPEEYMADQQQAWENNREELMPFVYGILISIIVSILSIIYLLCVAGRRYGDDEVHLTAYIDRIYTDILLVAGILGLVLWYVGVRDQFHVFDLSLYNESMNQIISMIYVGILTAMVAILCGIILLSHIRKIKGRKLIKHSLIFVLLSRVSDFIRSFFDDRRYDHYPLTKSLNRRQVIFTAASAVMVILTFLLLLSRVFFVALIPPVLEIVIIYWYFRENNKTFDEINKGFNESLEEQIKSERMKVDLITNVSHDLKTPLTSIISYVDLLSKEELPEAARDYVSILTDKSDRLKNIVSDLFDLAKSTSGNLTLNLENIDLKRLMEQTLADMEDEIANSNLQFRIKLTQLPVHIYSDGKKLYRVFQNIIGNTLKYSLTGTRVFIDMEKEGNMVSVTIKNTASYEMDFTEQEILQRFNRGDKSRTTEGSGLGISIAESFTRACGGSFKLDIDGDQFKVKLKFTIQE